MTLDEIAQELGITRQAVAEIIAKALRKIRKEMFKRNIKGDDFL